MVMIISIVVKQLYATPLTPLFEQIVSAGYLQWLVLTHRIVLMIVCWVAMQFVATPSLLLCLMLLLDHLFQLVNAGISSLVSQFAILNDASG